MSAHRGFFVSLHNRYAVRGVRHAACGLWFWFFFPAALPFSTLQPSSAFLNFCLVIFVL
jgi:hypothetical protein